MKKLLLFSFIGLFFAQVAKAQTCVPGYTTTGIYDDFSGATEPGNADGSGVYFWKASDAGFAATFSRNTTTGMLDVTYTQPYGQYSPFGISFGTSTTGKTYTIDLTNDASFSITFTNTETSITDSTIIFRIALQDSLGHLIDTYAAAGPSGAGGGNCDNAYAYTIAAPGQGPGQTYTLSGTFAGGYQADYSKANPAANGTTGTNCNLAQNIDWTIISQITITVVDATQNAADGYKSYALNNKTLSIDKIQVGAGCVSGVSAASSNIASAKLYPNPTSTEASVSLNLKSASNVKVTLTDMLGRQVDAISSGATSDFEGSFNVASLPKGVYTVNYYVNGQPAKAELLLVK